MGFTIDELEQLSPKVQAWLNSLSTPSPHSPAMETSQRVLWFCLSLYNQEHLWLSLISFKKKKLEGYLKNQQVELTFKNLWDDYPRDLQEAKQALTEEDWNIISTLIKKNFSHSYSGIALEFSGSGHALKQLIETGRCVFKDNPETPLYWGAPKQAQFVWTVQNNKKEQKLDLIFDEPGPTALKKLDPLCYFDPSTKSIGLIAFKEEPQIIKALLKAPVIPLQEIKQVRKLLSEKSPAMAKLAPNEIKETILQCNPQPCLKMYLAEFTYTQQRNQTTSFDALVANLTFRYGDYVIPYKLNEAISDEIVRNSPEEIVIIKRQAECERSFVKELSIYQWNSLIQESENHPFNFMFSNPQEALEGMALQQAEYIFCTQIPELKSKGWHVELADSFPIKKIHQNNEWFVEADETHSNASQDWFDVKLGVLIDGKHVNLIPSILNFIDDLNIHNAWEKFENNSADDEICIFGENKQLIKDPEERLWQNA